MSGLDYIHIINYVKYINYLNYFNYDNYVNFGKHVNYFINVNYVDYFNYASNTGLDTLRIKVRANCDMTKRRRRMKECRTIAV